MGFSVKPYLGSEPIVLISAYDDAIDWDATSEATDLTIEGYVTSPWKYQDKLVFLDGQNPVKIYMRAPTPFDLRDTEARQVILSGADEQIQIDQSNEAFELFRRCLEDMRDYFPFAGERLEVKKESGPGGRTWSTEATINAIPYEVIIEMGRYLRRSQQVGNELGNGFARASGLTTGKVSTD